MADGVTLSDVVIYAVRQERSEWIAVELRTDAEVSGWGEAPAVPNLDAAVRSFAQCQPHLVGRDATAFESIQLFFDQRRRQSGVDAGVVRAATNMALIDILGKLAHAPAYQVLGGPTRTKARALTALDGSDEQQLTASMHRAIQSGFRAVSVPLLPPGTTRGRRFYRDARQLLERLRESSKNEVDFVLDCHGQLTPAEATLLAQELESFHLLWLDEPCDTLQKAALAGVSAETSTPIGLGRTTRDIAEFQDLLRWDAVDVLRPDVSRWPPTSVRKAAALAETYYVAIAPRQTGGPIATAAGLQIAASVPNFFLIEIPLPTDEQELRRRRELAGPEGELVENGFVSLPQGPGLGLDINADALQQYRVEL